MNNEISPENNGPNIRVVLLFVAFFAVILAGIWLTLYVSHIEASECISHPDSSNLKTLTGKISQHPKHKTRYYLKTTDQRVVLLDDNYPRRTHSSSLSKNLSDSLGESASATFCGRQLLSININGTRVFTRDTSDESLLELGITFILILAFIFVLGLYGHKKISFKK